MTSRRSDGALSQDRSTSSGFSTANTQKTHVGIDVRINEGRWGVSQTVCVRKRLAQLSSYLVNSGKRNKGIGDLLSKQQIFPANISTKAKYSLCIFRTLYDYLDLFSYMPL
ncbi:hypothetical protein AMECASPLE_033854 [Ameca splendens]|uniref:Uncharacterized protein n=1 Tax=Ameca splendens TaxID=208324 RepID=A0ABV0Y7I0_9TELE